jgi:hypothetical protein
LRYLLSLALVLALACSNDITLPSEGTPKAPAAPTGWTDAPVGPPSALVSCAGLPNVGSIVKVNSYPATFTSVGNSFVVTGDIIRDNAGIAGTQFYCADWNTSLRWFTYAEGSPYCLTEIEAWPNGNKHSYRLQHTCPTGPTRRAIAYPYNAAGTTVISTKRDTTLVYP